METSGTESGFRSPISENAARAQIAVIENDMTELSPEQREAKRQKYIQTITPQLAANDDRIRELGGIPRLERGWAPINAESNDLYQFTMASIYLEKHENKTGKYLLYYRNPKDAGGMSIFGISRALDTLRNFKFHPLFLYQLFQQGKITEKLYTKLLNMEKLDLKIRAVQDGEFVGGSTPLMIVEGPLWQAQLVETTLLGCLDSASGSATRMATLAAILEKPVMEFGTRRASGEEGTVVAAIASVANGAVGAANTVVPIVAERYGLKGVDSKGTTAHAFTESYLQIDFKGRALSDLTKDEFQAYKEYNEVFPNAIPTVLIDTLKKETGLKTAIRLYKELGLKQIGVRDDSNITAESVLWIYDYLVEAGIPTEDFFIVISDGLSIKNAIDIRGGIEAERGAQFYNDLDIRAGVGGFLARPPIAGMVYKLAEWTDKATGTHRVSKASAVEAKASFPPVLTYRDNETFQDTNYLPEEEVPENLRLLQQEVDFSDPRNIKIKKADHSKVPREYLTGLQIHAPKFSAQAEEVRHRVQQSLKTA